MRTGLPGRMAGIEPAIYTEWHPVALPLSYIRLVGPGVRCPHFWTVVLAYHADAGGASVRAMSDL